MTSPIVISKDWPDFENLLNGTVKSLQLRDASTDSMCYRLIAVDATIVYVCTIYTSGNEPPSLTGSDLTNNTTWRTDYETNWKSIANSPVVHTTSIQQERKTAGHYAEISIYFDVQANSVAYKDIVVPNLTNGWDWINCSFYSGDATSGDFIATGKTMIGQIGAVAVAANQNATSIFVAAPIGVLRSTRVGGAVDEGYYLSFGTDTVTDAQINAANPPGNQTIENPVPELLEYQIQRIGAPTNNGNGTETVEFTLATALTTGITAGANANLIVRAFPNALRIVKGKSYDLGGRALAAGNIPAGTRIRFGYKNTASSVYTPTAELEVFYG
jgi:hypothetical protein